MTADDLWLKDFYTSSIRLLSNQTIIEYDMKSANTSLARTFELLPEDEIRKIEAMGKHARTVYVGLIKQKDKEYSKKEKNAFATARYMFAKANDINIHEVISIKRDALFLTRTVETEQIGKYILFRPKNEYTSYLYLKPLEIYYNQDGLDVKGIEDTMYQENHAEYFGALIHEILKRLEGGEPDQAIKFTMTVLNQYKRYELEAVYYKEFNAASNFVYLDGTKSKSEYLEDLHMLDISYNYKILTQIIQLLLKL